MSDSIIETRRTFLVDMFGHAPIKKAFGMIASYTAEGQARFDLPYNPDFDHALHGIHGGVFATLLDNAGWFTAAPYYDTWIATVEFNVRLLEHVQAEDLYSIGRIIKRGKRLAICEMEVRTSAEKLVAVGSGTFTPTSAELVIPQ